MKKNSVKLDNELKISIDLSIMTMHLSRPMTPSSRFDQSLIFLPVGSLSGPLIGLIGTTDPVATFDYLIGFFQGIRRSISFTPKESYR